MANVSMPDGSSRQVLFPDKSASAVEIRHFLRREGRLVVPEGAVLISVEVRLLQGGKLLSSQLVSL